MAKTAEAEMTWGELLREAVEELRRIARLEGRMVAHQLEEGEHRAKQAGLLLAAAMALGMTGLGTLAAAVGDAVWGRQARGALTGAAALLGGAGLVGFLGWRRLPREVLAETAEKLKEDADALKTWREES